MFGTREELCLELERMFTQDEPLALLIWTEEGVHTACHHDKPTDEEVMLLLETIGSVDMECYREEGVTNKGIREVLMTLREDDGRCISVPASVLERLLKKLERDLIREEGIFWDNGRNTSDQHKHTMNDVQTLKARLAA